jgi:hypothetical protein
MVIKKGDNGNKWNGECMMGIKKEDEWKYRASHP